MDGFKEAIRLGFTHALQIDADGQHDFNDISEFLEASRVNPHAMIPGNPLFDETVPGNRLYGRKLTNLWNWINTFSFAITDGMRSYLLLSRTVLQVFLYPVGTYYWLINRSGRRAI